MPDHCAGCQQPLTPEDLQKINPEDHDGLCVKCTRLYAEEISGSEVYDDDDNNDIPFAYL